MLDLFPYAQYFMQIWIMNNELLRSYQDHADVYKALSHPTRLFIIHEIAKNKRSVSELANQMEIDISTMSKHLEVLKKCKIISGEKESNQVFYKLQFNCVLNFFNCINNNIKKNP